MHNRSLFCFSLIPVLLVVSCTVLQQDEKTTETRIAAKVFATLTASVPTATATPPMVCPTPPSRPQGDHTGSQVYRTFITGKYLSKSQVLYTAGGGEPYLQLDFDPEGTRILEDFTVRKVGTYVGLVVNKTIHSSPILATPIHRGTLILSGRYTYSEADELSRLLTECPTSLELVELGDSPLPDGEIIQTVQ